MCLGTVLPAAGSEVTVSFASCNISPTNDDNVQLDIISTQQLTITPTGVNMMGIYDQNSIVTPTL